MLHEKRRLKPPPLEKASSEIADFIETYFNAYNAARLRESCQLFAKMIDAGATIGLSISGALTPAGLSSVLTPLMRKGFIDYISSTGANLYHDLHFDLGLPVYRVMMAPEFHKRMGTAELHHKIGKYALETAAKTGTKKPSILATAHELDL